MKTAIRFSFLGMGALVLLSAIALTVVLCMRGQTPDVDGKDGIASLQTVRLGGVEQWILIRGQDTSKPVLLFLHGGPGMPAMFLEHECQRALEHDFVVVHWDRRGAGKSFDAVPEGASLSVSQTLEDTYELSRYLRGRFRKDRIYIIGHSWGSYLGLLAVHGHPEYYKAYIGMGQLAGTRTEAEEVRKRFLVAEARKANDKKLSASLADPGFEPSENDLFRYGGELHDAQSVWPIVKTGLFAPEYTLRDIFNVKKGVKLVSNAMQYDVSPKPLEGEISDFSVPIFFFLGRFDYNTPSTLAADYLDRLNAPQKGVVWFEESAHFPFFEQPEKFHTQLLHIIEETNSYWESAHRNDRGPPTEQEDEQKSKR